MDALTPVRRALRTRMSDRSALRHMNTLLNRTGLSVSRIWSSERPVPNHPTVPVVAFAHTPQRNRLLRHVLSRPCEKLMPESGLRHLAAGSPTGQAETGSLFYGLLVHLLLLSTPPRGDAVTVDYRSEHVDLKRTCTSLTKYAYRRTGTGVSPVILVGARCPACESCGASVFRTWPADAKPLVGF